MELRRTMEWINPRDKLPEHDQLIWALFIENREGERSGDPSASLTICKARKDAYGVVSADEILHRGYPYGHKYFFKWYHYDQSGTPEDEIRESISSGYDDDKEMIIAWMPYNGLPAWDKIDIDESKDIIIKYPGYHEACMRQRTIRAAEKSHRKISPYFLYLVDHQPPENGVYVVANSSGVWLSRYDKELCNPWIAPNGEPVTAWYSIPQSF